MIKNEELALILTEDLELFVWLNQDIHESDIRWAKVPMTWRIFPRILDK